MKLAILASGSGTILESILEQGIVVDLLLADRSCRAIEVARHGGVDAILLERREFSDAFDRETYTSKTTAALVERGVDVIAMAGYGTILGAAIHDAYPFRILNTHPSLLPSFPGWHAVRSALDYGVKVTGCTVHLARHEVDSGPILAQEAVSILPSDTESTLHERIKHVERALYPKVIARFVTYLSGKSFPERDGDFSDFRL